LGSHLCHRVVVSPFGARRSTHSSGEDEDPAPPSPPDGGACGWTCCEARNGRTRHWPPGLRRRRQEMAGGSPPAPPPRRPARITTPAAMLDGRASGTRSNAAPPASTATTPAEMGERGRRLALLRPPVTAALSLTGKDLVGREEEVEWIGFGAWMQC
jgi:hypothetical protein